MAAGSLPLPTGRPGQALAVALLLAVAALAWSSAAAPLTDLYASRAESLAQRTTLARRMAQATADLPALQQASSRFVAAGPPPAALLSGAGDAVAGATLQQLVQDMAARTGATLSSSETMPAEQAGAYRRIAVRVALSAPWPVLASLLRSIAEASPGMLVDDMQLHGTRQIEGTGELPMDASLTVLGFRAADAKKS